MRPDPETLELLKSVLGSLKIVVGDLDWKILLAGALIANLLLDPGLVGDLREMLDELIAAEWSAHTARV